MTDATKQRFLSPIKYHECFEHFPYFCIIYAMYTFASLNFPKRYRHHGLGIIVGRVPNSSWQRGFEHENRDRVVSTKQETVFVVQGKPQLFTRISCTAFWSKVVITNFSVALTAIREGKKEIAKSSWLPAWGIRGLQENTISSWGYTRVLVYGLNGWNDIVSPPWTYIPRD